MKKIKRHKHRKIDQKKNIMAKLLDDRGWSNREPSNRELYYGPFEKVQYLLIKCFERVWKNV